VEEPDRHETNGGRLPEPGEPVGGSEEWDEEDTAEVEVGRGVDYDPEELRTSLGIKDNRIRELYEQITVSRLAVEEPALPRRRVRGTSRR
jgi:hypothetical protein